jgi:ParB family transcriptional regulator, chromosome partitioning protein
MTDLSIEYKSVDDLIPYVNNSRTHSDEQVTQVAASIKEFGFTNPILIDENNGIIAGHGRLMAAKKLKLEQVPTITLEGLTDAQRKAYVIADNKLALNAEWDFDLLKIEIESLQEDDFKLDLLGFDVDELNGVLGFDDIAEEDEEEPEQDYEDKYKEQYGVIIMCKSAEEQEKIFNKMQQNGYEVKVVCT